MGWAKRVFGSGDQKEAGRKTRIRSPESEREVTFQPDDEVWDLRKSPGRLVMLISIRCHGCKRR